MTNLLQFTINVRKLYGQGQCTFQLQREDRVLFVSVDLTTDLHIDIGPLPLQYGVCVPFTYSYFRYNIYDDIELWNRLLAVVIVS
jgi:hypothetical protein